MSVSLYAVSTGDSAAEGGCLKKCVCMLAVLLLMGCSESDNPSKVDLPMHVVAGNTSLAPKDGKRIQINTENADLSKEDCVSLIDAYREMAGPEGQVSVHKPSPKLKGQRAPWCVDNMDGKGVWFHESLF